MEITIGMEFKKQVGKNYIKCEVVDIYDVISTSRKHGNVIKRVVYYAKAKTTANGIENVFEVAKNTILRGL